MGDETPQLVLGPMAGALGLVLTLLVPGVLGQGRGPQAEVGGGLQLGPHPGNWVCAVLGGNSWGGGGASPFLACHPSRLSWWFPHGIPPWEGAELVLTGAHWCDLATGAMCPQMGARSGSCLTRSRHASRSSAMASTPTSWIP